MSDHRCFRPLISRLYVRFVREGNSAAFIRSVAQTYTLATLHRVSREGDCVARRGAVLAITYLGGAESIAAVGQALRDTDRAVRLIAESGDPDATRAGLEARQPLGRLVGPEEVAAAIVYLAAPTTYTSGQELVLDGGISGIRLVE